MDLCVDVTQIKRSKAQDPRVARLRESAATIVAASGAVIVAFDRHFISNPDLPERLRRDLPLTRHDRSTWRGYIDYSTRVDMVPAALQIRPKL